MEIKTGDIVYLKSTFKKVFTKKSILKYNPRSMNVFQGRKVKIIGVVLNYTRTGIEGKISCSMMDITENKIQSEILLLDCIDKSKPLIRNNKKYSLLNKELYLFQRTVKTK